MTPRRWKAASMRCGRSGGYFHAKKDPDKKPFTIVMPPPNVTGQLHMGHAMDCTLQDILIRFKRMQGYSCPVAARATDHAGIATQIKVEEELRERGPDPLRPGPGEVPGARLGLERAVRRPHRGAAEEAGRLLRLGAATGSPWTRAAPRPCGRCLSTSMKRA